MSAGSGVAHGSESGDFGGAEGGAEPTTRASTREQLAAVAWCVVKKPDDDHVSLFPKGSCCVSCHCYEAQSGGVVVVTERVSE